MTTSGRRRRPLSIHRPVNETLVSTISRPKPTKTATPPAGEGRHRKTERQGPADHLLAWPRRLRGWICRSWGLPCRHRAPLDPLPLPWRSASRCAAPHRLQRCRLSRAPMVSGTVPRPRPPALARAKITGERMKKRIPAGVGADQALLHA
jgi:hypothetical protein